MFNKIFNKDEEHRDIFCCLILFYVLYIYKATFILASKSVFAWAKV